MPSTTREEVIHLVCTFAAGAVGGLLFWVLGRLTGSPVATAWGPLGTILAFLFVGAIAAAVGVYLLTASDLKATKTYIFAIICGLVWQPILDSGKRLVTNAAATQRTEAVNANVQRITSAANSGDASQVVAAAKQTVPSVTDALKQASAVDDPEKRQELLQASTEAINALQSAYEKAPTATADSLKEISFSAVEARQPAIAIKAVESLRFSATASARKNDPQGVADATQSLQSIASGTSDVAVKSAANASVLSIKAATSAQRQ